MNVSPLTPTIRILARAVIIRDDNLLAIEIDDGTDRWWSLPGGGQEYGETAAEAVVRECREELQCEVNVGICIMVREFIGPRRETTVGNVRDLHGLENFFMCDLLTEPDLHPREEFHKTIRWIAISELRKIQFFPKVLAQSLSKILDPKSPVINVYVGDVD